LSPNVGGNFSPKVGDLNLNVGEVAFGLTSRFGEIEATGQYNGEISILRLSGEFKEGN